MPIVRTGDFATYHEEAGAGEPLTLICGLSANLQMWRFQVPELSKRFRVICYDNRGAGRTDAPAVGANLSYLCRGSSASRRPSPSRLNDSTSRKIDTPGQIAIHGAWST